MMVELDKLKMTHTVESEAQFHVTVMAATNLPSAIDSSLLQPGRFDHLVFVGLPDDLSRRNILVTFKLYCSTFSSDNILR